MDDKKLMKILDTSEERIDIYLDFIKGSEFACPICNKPCKIHDTKDRSWRHLPLFHYESYIHARVPRTKCEEHGTKIVDIPWSRHDTGFTSLFEADIVALCKEIPVASVAERVKIHEESAWSILAYHVNEAREHVDLLQLDTIGVDEIAVKKGQRYD